MSTRIYKSTPRKRKLFVFKLEFTEWCWGEGRQEKLSEWGKWHEVLRSQLNETENKRYHRVDARPVKCENSTRKRFAWALRKKKAWIGLETLDRVGHADPSSQQSGIHWELPKSHGGPKGPVRLLCEKFPRARWSEQLLSKHWILEWTRLFLLYLLWPWVWTNEVKAARSVSWGTMQNGWWRIVDVIETVA